MQVSLASFPVSSTHQIFFHTIIVKYYVRKKEMCKKKRSWGVETGNEAIYRCPLMVRMEPGNKARVQTPIHELCPVLHVHTQLFNYQQYISLRT